MAFGRKSDAEYLAERLGGRVPVVVFSVDCHNAVLDKRTHFGQLLINFETQDPGSQPNLREACARYDTDDKRAVAFSRDERGNWFQFDSGKGDRSPVGVPYLKAALDRALRIHLEETAKSSRARTQEVLRRAAAGSRGGR